MHKKTTYISLLLLLLFPTGMLAQTTIGDMDPPGSEHPITTQPRGVNMLSCNSYKNISYNGYTITQINDTEGNLEQLWGTPASVENLEGAREKIYKWGQNVVAYNYEFQYVSAITIKDSQWAVQIQGKTVRVDDSFSELQQKFGADLKIRHNPDIKPEYFVVFGCTGSNYDGLIIYLHPSDNKVDKITYFVNP